MSKPKRKFYMSLAILWGIGAGMAFIFTGCVGGNQNSTLNEIQESSGEKAAQNPVEAYIEYVGAPQRWAGPTTLMVYLNARNNDNAEIQVTPSPVMHHSGEVSARIPASQKVEAPSKEVRKWLAELAEVATVPIQSAGGCLYPVRVRLIGQDSQIKEFVGCRGSMGWTSKMNEVTSRALAVAWGN